MATQVIQIKDFTADNTVDESVQANNWNFPILETKLTIPASYHKLVNRSLLMEKLQSKEETRLTLVTAPAGSGKSTLVGEWVRQTKIPSAWLSLDIHDNDPFVFLNYLIAALQKVAPEIGESLLTWIQGSELPAIPPLMTHLLNDILEHNQAFILVLDDYHLIQDSVVQEIMKFLVEHLPPCVHLMISGRAEPMFPLSKLRVRNQLVELGGSDLSFSLDETKTFLNSSMDIELTAKQVERLKMRTEGWVAGLQLAALSLRTQSDVDEFITEFAGSDSYIADFLVEEVLNAQSDEIQNFLLQTSILDRFSEDLSRAVVGGEQSLQIIKELEKKGLFLIPLDHKNCWFRYHHMFSEALQHILHERFPELVTELHARASLWHEEQGNNDAAMRHALKSENYPRFVKMFDALAQRLTEQNRFGNLVRRFKEVPEKLLGEFPILRIWKAWCMLLEGDIEKLRQNLEAAAEAVAPPAGVPFDPALHDPENVMDYVNSIRTYVVRISGNMEKAIQMAEQNSTQLSMKSGIPWIINTFNLSSCYRNVGRLEEAYEILEPIQTSSQEGTESTNTYSIALSFRSDFRFRQGRLKESEAFALQIDRLFNSEGNRSTTAASGYFSLSLAKVHHQRNELEAANQLAHQAFVIGREGAEWMIYFQACQLLVQLERSSGDKKAMMEYVEHAEEAAPRARVLHVTLEVPAMRAWAHLDRDELEKAVAWSQTCGLLPSDPPNVLRKFDQMVLIRVLFAQKKNNEALLLLDPLLLKLEELGMMGNVIELLILKALILPKDSKSAMESLGRALTLAESEQFIRLFLDEGTPMQDLLNKVFLVKLDFPEHFARLLLKHFEEQSSEPQASGLFEALSERERAVLSLIAKGFSNQKIAKELFVSLNTVKTHTRNIYSKMEVRSRTEATVKAQALKLI